MSGEEFRPASYAVKVRVFLCKNCVLAGDASFFGICLYHHRLFVSLELMILMLVQFVCFARPLPQLAFVCCEFCSVPRAAELINKSCVAAVDSGKGGPSRQEKEVDKTPAGASGKVLHSFLSF